MTTPGRAFSFCFCLTALAACGDPPPGAPSPVIDATPAQLCRGDDHRTPIRLSAGDSAPHLTLVPVPPNPAEPPLAFTWSFGGAEVRVIEGDLHAAELTITSAADRPVHVGLTVENGDGGVGRALQTLAVEEGGACAAEGSR